MKEILELFNHIEKNLIRLILVFFIGLVIAQLIHTSNLDIVHVLNPFYRFEGV